LQLAKEVRGVSRVCPTIGDSSASPAGYHPRVRVVPRIVIAALLMAWPSVARAVALSWDAPEGCPSAADVQDEVTRIVGEHERRQVTIRAQARQNERGWTLELHTRAGDEEGERTVQGATCEEVAKAAVVIIALSIDPDVMGAVQPPPPPTLPLPSPEPPPRPPTPPPETAAWHAVVLSGAGVSFATPPGATPFVWAAGGLRMGRIAGHAGVMMAAETSESAPLLPSAGGSFWLISAFGRGCLAPLLGRLEVWGCGGLEIDRLAARGYGVTRPGSGSDIWFAPAIGVEPGWAVASSLRVALPMWAAFPLDRRNFTLAGVGPLFRTSVVLPRVSLALQVLF
jgi:hypothetical protein